MSETLALTQPPLLPPKSLFVDDGDTRTPSLTSSLTSADSSEHQPTPPQSARRRSGLSKLAVDDDEEVSSPISLESPDTTTDDLSLRPRPARPAQPSFLRVKPITNKSRTTSSDHVSIISFTYDRKSLGARSQSSFSRLLLRGSQSYLVLLTEHKRVLASLLSFMDFPEFHSMCCTSKAMRRLLDEHSLRDVVLSRFVSGYRLGAEQHRTSREEDIYVEIKDLEALMLSQAIPLHVYTENAARTMAGLAPMSESSTRLRQFTDVHSRFVLLMRSRARPLSATPDYDDVPPSTRLDTAGVRQLSLPLPLAFEHEAETSQPTRPTFDRHKTSRSLDLPRPKRKRLFGWLTGGPSSPPQERFPRRPTSASESFTLPPAMMFQEHARMRLRNVSTRSVPLPRTPSVVRRRSNSHRLPLPPKEETPRAMKEFRRQSTLLRGMNIPSTPPGSTGRRSVLQALQEASFDQDWDFEPPTKPWHLRASSLPSSSASGSEASLLLRQTRNSPVAPSSPWPASPGPHDLVHSSCRMRAAVCRVFVPCSDWSESSLLACEGQLAAASLWGRLNVGDVVCNLGFVNKWKPDEDYEIVNLFGSEDPRSSSPSEGWMVFTGRNLAPLNLPAPPPSTIAPFALPTPLYYTHILPSPTPTTASSSINPRFYLPFPSTTPLRITASDVSLTSVTTCVSSPGTKDMGVVKVVRWCWVAKIDATKVFEEDAVSKSSWGGEWVVEAEGTKEGKEALVDAVNGRVVSGSAALVKEGEGGGEMGNEWEVVRERSVPGSRLWLRLVITPPPTSDSTDELGRLLM